MSSDGAMGASKTYVFFVGIHCSCILEAWGGYTYGDASLNSYFKFGINFRTNNVADFYEIHKMARDRLRVGYRMYGTENDTLGIVVSVVSASSFVVKLSGGVRPNYFEYDSAPGDTTWL